jgi:hypothetical protein
MSKITNFSSGAIRDSQDGKYDIAEYISHHMLHRYYEHMHKSAVKYGAGNWRKGIPKESGWKSLRRHIFQADLWEVERAVMCKNRHITVPEAVEYFGGTYECLRCGELVPFEDHLAAAIFNINIIMHDECSTITRRK